MTTLINHPHVYSKYDQIVLKLSRHGMAIVNILMGFYVILPFLAPAFMAANWIIPGKIIYWIYSFLCHQLPQRSYFLFGPKISYTIPEIQVAWPYTDNIAVLRQFTGNPPMGWKVAWSDRMVSMFTSQWLFGVLWVEIKKKVKPLPWWGLILLITPLTVDGATHLMSDLGGFGQGFRDSNSWLAILTHHIFATNFYGGDAWGSFNAWMRLITGALFGVGIAWFGYPYLAEAFSDSVEAVEYKYQYRTRLKIEPEHSLHQFDR